RYQEYDRQAAKECEKGTAGDANDQGGVLGLGFHDARVKDFLNGHRQDHELGPDHHRHVIKPCLALACDLENPDLIEIDIELRGNGGHVSIQSRLQEAADDFPVRPQRQPVGAVTYQIPDITGIQKELTGGKAQEEQRNIEIDEQCEETNGSISEQMSSQ